MVGFVDGIANIPLNLTLLKRCSVIGVNWGGEVLANPAIVPPVIERIINWSLAGKLQTKPDKVYSMEDAGKAFAALFDRTSLGKVVISPNA